MLKSAAALAGTLALGLVTTAASAAPVSGARDNPAPNAGLVEKTQGYHRHCYWTGTGWGYKSRGKVLVCRPYRPRGNWVWYSEGPRHGWYDAKRKVWHNNKW